MLKFQKLLFISVAQRYILIMLNVVIFSDEKMFEMTTSISQFEA